jgi:hypothetical protein
MSLALMGDLSIVFISHRFSLILSTDFSDFFS